MVMRHRSRPPRQRRGTPIKLKPEKGSKLRGQERCKAQTKAGGPCQARSGCQSGRCSYRRKLDQSERVCLANAVGTPRILTKRFSQGARDQQPGPRSLPQLQIAEGGYVRPVQGGVLQCVEPYSVPGYRYGVFNRIRDKPLRATNRRRIAHS